MTSDHSTANEHTRVFGADGKTCELARRVNDELLTSAAWTAYIAGFGNASDRRYGWVSIDGCPFTPVEFGLEGANSAADAWPDADACSRPSIELTEFLAQP